MTVEEAWINLSKLKELGYGSLPLVAITTSGDTTGVYIDNQVSLVRDNEDMGILCVTQPGIQYIAVNCS